MRPNEPELPTPALAATSVLTPVRRFVAIHLVALLPLLTAGIIAYGWRVLLAIGLLLGGTALGYLAWRHVGRRGRLLDPLHLAWLSGLLVCMLPPHLAANVTPLARETVSVALWPILPAGGLLLVALTWLLGGTTGGRILPPLAVYLVLALFLGESLSPHLALNRERAVVGDLLDYHWRPLDELSQTPWMAKAPMYEGDAVWRTPVREVLSAYTAGLARPERRAITMGSVLRDRMPPLEDLITLGHPTPMGLASAAALLAAGLFLFYRGVADVRIPILALAGAYLTFAIAPVPALIEPEGPVWTWGLGFGGGVLERGPAVGWDVGLTFVHYEMLAGPILFIAVFLAPLASLRPLAGRWRIFYALLLGPLMALAQRFGDTELGPYGALLIVSALTPLMDRLTQARTLV